MDIEKIFAAATKEIENNDYPGLSDTEELKACLFDLLPLQQDNIRSLTVQGTLNKFKAIFYCALPEDNLEKFISSYNKKTNETLKLAISKSLTSKSGYEINKTFRCHHNTRYHGTKDTAKVFEEKPAKRFKNTSCPFKMEIKKLKSNHDGFPFLVTLHWNHNHPVNSLQAWNFKDIPANIIEEVHCLYEKGLTPALAYREYMTNLKECCKDDLDFHHRKGDRSKCPRRGDFYNIYTEFCKSHFGAKNGEEMLAALDEKVEKLKEQYPEMQVQKQDYDEGNDSPFILAFVTPLMKRVHVMVRVDINPINVHE